MYFKVGYGGFLWRLEGFVGSEDYEVCSLEGGWEGGVMGIVDDFEFCGCGLFLDVFGFLE